MGMLNEGIEFIASSEQTSVGIAVGTIDGAELEDYGLDNFLRMDTVEMLATMLVGTGSKSLSERMEQVAVKARNKYVESLTDEATGEFFYDGVRMDESTWIGHSEDMLVEGQQEDMAKLAKLVGWVTTKTRGRAKVWTWKELKADDRVEKAWIEDNDGELQYWVELKVGRSWDEKGGARARSESRVADHLESLNSGCAVLDQEDVVDPDNGAVFCHPAKEEAVTAEEAAV